MRLAVLLLLLVSLVALGFTREALVTEEDEAWQAVGVDDSTTSSRVARAAGRARNPWPIADDDAGRARNPRLVADDATIQASNPRLARSDTTGRRRHRQRKATKPKKIKTRKQKTGKGSRSPDKGRKLNRNQDGKSRKRANKTKIKGIKTKKGVGKRIRKRPKEGVVDVPLKVMAREDTIRITKLLEVCSSTYTLLNSEAIVIYSDNTGQRAVCKSTLKSPSGTQIGFTCPQFNLNPLGCKKEKMILAGSVDTRETKRTFCGTASPEGVVLETNVLTLRYKRKECSGGFVCVAYTVGGTDNTIAGPTVTGPTLCSATRPYCDGCGVAPISLSSDKVVNGDDASEGEYPYQAYISGCGGSLIKQKWVLTAAHCFPRGTSVNGLEVILGTISLDKLDAGSLVVPVQRVIIHENYDGSNFVNDIALVELSQKVTFTDKIKPICLAEDGDIPFGGKAVATGWGVLEYNSLDFPEVLQEVELDVTSDQVCRDLGGADPTLFICALTQFKDSCAGDSGGPLVARACDGRWVQIGIVSHGVGCAFPNNPGVYTRVPSYISWITSNTGSDTC